jgi:hypothetical protein
MTISVADVAGIMRAFGAKNGNPEWDKPATLQEIWFGHAAHVASPVAPDIFDYTLVAWPAKTGITIDWLLRPDVDSNGRAKMPFGMLQAMVLEPDGEVRPKIKDQVIQLFESTDENAVELGKVSWTPDMDVKAFHAQRVGFVSVQTDPVATPIDPLLGSLGSFNFYAVPVGSARKGADGVVKVDIREFLLYALDSFDFIGVQVLGFFKQPDEISRSPFDGGTLITNAGYNAWRSANQKGGDFLVMTDARTAHLPLSFEFTPPASVNGSWRSADPKGRFAVAINGGTAEWTETGVETGIVYKKTLPVTRQGDEWHVARPNSDAAVLKMLGFQDPALQQAILQHGPRDSSLVLKIQGAGLAAKWSGIRVQKTPQGAFRNLLQPGDPANPPTDYAFQRI